MTNAESEPVRAMREYREQKERERSRRSRPAPYSKDIAGIDPAAGGFPHTREDEAWVAHVRWASGGDHHKETY
jgi:hypothetical protein